MYRFTPAVVEKSQPVMWRHGVLPENEESVLSSDEGDRDLPVKGP
jgi:hypothetical protein